MFRNICITKIFCDVDDFCKDFQKYCNQKLLSCSELIRVGTSSLSPSEVMTILILFHLSGYRTLKAFYIDKVLKYYRSEFPGLISYVRFVELEQQVLPVLTLYLGTRTSDGNGVGFIDSTKIGVCSNFRISSNKVFKGIAKRGKTSTGWFYGFKLHLIIDAQGEIISFAFTTGNVSDGDIRTVDKLTRRFIGKLYGDKGYIGKTLFDMLFKKGIHLITKVRKNMKNKLMELYDKLLLSKRAVIESVNNILKNVCQIEHTRHRCITNFFVNLIAGIIAYTYLPKKPSINVNITDKLRALNLTTDSSLLLI